MFRRLLLTITLMALGAAGAPTAAAQSSEDAPALESQTYTDAALKSFALAAINVQRIKDIYVPQLEAASTPVEADQVREAATKEMVQAIEGEGMTVSQYTEISTQLKADPELAKRVEEHLREAIAK
jgi:hypothetical protein